MAHLKKNFAYVYIVDGKEASYGRQFSHWSGLQNLTQSNANTFPMLRIGNEVAYYKWRKSYLPGGKCEYELFF